MGTMPEGLLKWREKQKRGAIMEPSTFAEIKESAARGGATNPEAVAGAAYWRTAKAKYQSHHIKKAAENLRKK